MQKENENYSMPSSDEAKKTIESIKKIKKSLDETRNQMEDLRNSYFSEDIRKRVEAVQERYEKITKSLLPNVKFKKLKNLMLNQNTIALEEALNSEDQIKRREKIERTEGKSILSTFGGIVEREEVNQRVLKEVKDLRNTINELKDEIKQSKSLTKEDIGEQSTKSRNNIRFPSAEGLNWRQIAITFISSQEVRIRAKKVVKKYSYSEMGFTDKRKGNNPDTLWTILQLFAQLKGEVNWENYTEDLKEKNKLKERVKVIRKRLKQFFCLEEDPFEPYKESKAYRTKFEINSETIF